MSPFNEDIKGQPIEFPIKEVFATGAQRDQREGKGRYDLIPPFPIFRIARVFERGARHYGDRNWEKGMPIGRFLDSAQRHVGQYLAGKINEDHLAHAAWNLLAAMQMELNVYKDVVQDVPHPLDDIGTMSKARSDYLSLAGFEHFAD